MIGVMISVMIGVILSVMIGVILSVMIGVILSVMIGVILSEISLHMSSWDPVDHNILQTVSTNIKYNDNNKTNDPTERH